MSFFEKKGPGKSAPKKRSESGSAAALAAAVVAGGGLVLANSASAAENGYTNAEGVVTNYVENANGSLDVTLSNGTVQTIPAGQWMISNGQLYLSQSGLGSLAAAAGSAGAALLGLMLVNAARADATESVDEVAEEVVPTIDFTLDQQDSIAGHSGDNIFAATHETMHSTDTADAAGGSDTLQLDMGDSPVTLGTLTNFETLEISNASSTLDLNGVSFSEGVVFDDLGDNQIKNNSVLMLENRDDENAIAVSNSNGILTVADGSDLDLTVQGVGDVTLDEGGLLTSALYYQLGGTSVTSADITVEGDAASAVSLNGLSALTEVTVEGDGNGLFAINAGIANTALTKIDASESSAHIYVELDTTSVTQIDTGSGIDFIDIQATPSGKITINHGEGNDFFSPSVGLSDAVDEINGEEGDDYFLLTGSDYYDFSDSGNPFGTSGDLDGATLDGGEGDDFFSLLATDQTGVLTLKGGAGFNLFEIKGGSFDTLTIEGGDESDQINLSTATVGTVSDVSTSDASYEYPNVTGAAGLTVKGGDGKDYINVNTILPATHSIDGGDGDDEFYIGGAQVSNMTLEGGAGDDVFELGQYAAANQVDTTTDTWISNTTSLTHTLKGGEGADVFDFATSYKDAPTDDDNGSVFVIDMGAADGAQDTILSQAGLISDSNWNEVVIKNFEAGDGGDVIDLTEDTDTLVLNQIVPGREGQIGVVDAESGSALLNYGINIINYANASDVTDASAVSSALGAATTVGAGAAGAESYFIIDDGTDSALWHVHDVDNNGGLTSPGDFQLLYTFEGVADATQFTHHNFTDVDSTIV